MPGSDNHKFHTVLNKKLWLGIKNGHFIGISFLPLSAINKGSS